MVIQLKIDDINPRLDDTYVLQRVQKFLDECDPDDRADLKIERACR